MNFVYLVIIICTLSMCIGQVFLKYTSNQLLIYSNYLEISVILPFVAAVFIYSLATIAWVWALKFIPLSRAFPFVALSYIFVPLLCWFYFGESLNLRYFIGVILIIVGVYISTT